jgi:glycine/D-amino acid oxidase-like deaminating enzyme
MIQQGHFGKNTTVDGGFYTQTPDNTPLIGRVQKDLKTVLTISGLSGYGIMMSCGAADLLCCEIVSSDNDNDDTRRMMKSHRVLLESFRPSRDFSQTSSSCDGSNDDVPHALKIIGGSI